MSLAPGSHLGVYEVLSALGAGGMGEVYRARDTRLGRDVAIKVLPAAFAADPERIARFEREAKTLASLNHPHIAHVHGLERSGTTSALVMELVEGEDLSERLARGPIPLDEAVPIARQIAEALEVAHEHGVIHRDLKPANIKVRADGDVKVLDFGLAKAIETAGASRHGEEAIISSPTITTPAMTMRGVILGTAAYMAPEQAKGKPVDRRADIWAFGCVFYEMLTGKRPFYGEDVSETLAAVLKEQPEWKPLPADTPANIRRLLERCLQKDPQKRLPHIGVARLELAEPFEVTPAAPAANKRSVVPWMVLSGVLAIALALVALPWRRAPVEPSPSSVRVNVDIGVNASLANGFGASAVLSPDGKMLAFAAASDQSHLYVRPLDRLDATRLAGTEGARDPFFSPDGQWLGFFAANRLKKVAVSGGAPVILAEVVNGHGASWGDDDRIVFAPSFNFGPLRRVPAAGGSVETLNINAADPSLRVQRWPQVLPGAKMILFTSHSAINAMSNAQMVVENAATGEFKVVHRGGYHGRYLPSGHLVYMNSGTLFAVGFDLDRLETVGTPTPVLSNIVGNPDNGGAQFAFANNGYALAMVGDELSTAQPIFLIERTGATKPILAKPTEWANLNFSSDGNRLVVNIRDGLTDVWVQDLERGTLSRLPATPANKDYPIWSADGRRITFGTNESGGVLNNIYWQRADGSGPLQRLTTSPNPQRAGSWHPSGKALAYHEINPQTSNDIWILPIEGDEQSGWKPGTPTPFVTDPAQQVDPIFSPDGTWIAYWSLETGSEVFVRPYPGPGGKWQISSGGGQTPVWSHTSDELLFMTPTGEIMVASYRVVGDEFRAERPRLWSQVRLMLRGGGQRSWSLHPDGTRVAGVPQAPEDVAKRDKIMLLLNFFDEVRRAVPVAAQ